MSDFTENFTILDREKDISDKRKKLTRRAWFVRVPVALAAVTTMPLLAENMSGGAEANTDLYPEFPSQDPSLVREVVRVSHFDFKRLQELVTASPALAKATWDWGFGDWESALGAASHVGRRDIAELLIEHGARPNLFTSTMLGHLQVVQAYVKAMPDIQQTAGPHGITLLQHARNGGEEAKPVLEYLLTLGDADNGQLSLEISEEQQKFYIGHYTFSERDNDVFEILKNSRGALAIKRGDRSSRTLHRVEEHGFAPIGAPAVRIRFQIRNERAVSLTIHDPEPLVTARRIIQ